MIVGRASRATRTLATPSFLTSISRSAHSDYFSDRMENPVWRKHYKQQLYPMETDEENTEADKWESTIAENNNNEFLMRVMRKAKKRRDMDPKSWLIKRLPGSSPTTWRDDYGMPKALHYARLQMTRRHLQEKKLTEAWVYEKAYRDLDDLDLTLPEGSEDWKTDMLEGFRMELTKNAMWTTGQKERFLLEAKRRFTEDYGEGSGHDVLQWLVEDTDKKIARIKEAEEKEKRFATVKTNTRRKRRQR